MSLEQEGRARITNPARILRIFHRICQAGLQVMVRTPGSRNTAVRGRAAAIQEIPKKGRGIRIADISDVGIKHLGDAELVRVELKGMTTHVLFDGPILQREDRGIIVGMPKALISVERRKNARFQTLSHHNAYVSMSRWQPTGAQLADPPILEGMQSLSGLLRVVDVSHGGFCLMSRFASPLEFVRPGMVDDHAMIHLPMQPVMPVSFEVRWFKRIRERAQGDAEMFARRLLFGVEIRSESEETRKAILRFIKELAMAEAI